MEMELSTSPQTLNCARLFIHNLCCYDVKTYEFYGLTTDASYFSW